MRGVIKEIHKIQENQAIQNKLLKKEVSIMKSVIKEDLQTMKTNFDGLQQEMVDIKKTQHNLELQMDKRGNKLEEMEILTRKLQRQQELTEIKELEYQLRFRNIEETEKEDLRQIITDMTADILEITEAEMSYNIDPTYRINTNFARKNKTARDVIVHFGRKSIRDEILKRNAQSPIYYKGKKVAVLKEFPTATLDRRWKYFFLTDELKRLNIKFN